jgi:hypothetical protein
VKKGERWSSGPARPHGREEPATAHLTCERRREGGEPAYATADYESRGGDTAGGVSVAGRGGVEWSWVFYLCAIIKMVLTHKPLKILNAPRYHHTKLFCIPWHFVHLVLVFHRLKALTCGPDQWQCPKYPPLRTLASPFSLCRVGPTCQWHGSFFLLKKRSARGPDGRVGSMVSLEGVNRPVKNQLQQTLDSPTALPLWDSSIAAPTGKIWSQFKIYQWKFKLAKFLSFLQCSSSQINS